MRRILGCRVLPALCIMVLPALVAGPATAKEVKEPRNVALLRMDLPRGFYPDEREALADQLLSALHRTGSFEIVAREDLAAVLEELRFQASDLVDGQEVAELGALAGVDLFVTLSVHSVEGFYQITARLISVETGKVERIASRKCTAKVDFLSALFDEIAFELAGEEGKKGWLLIETDPPEAEVFLFGVPLGTTPLTRRMAPGTYLLSVERRGYGEQRKTLYVDEGQETSWKVELVKKNRFRLGDYIRGGGFWDRD
jgi:hypothetical protein